ncbi:MAG: shikimate dehydrogenase [Patescibacteria group bacterium]
MQEYSLVSPLRRPKLCYEPADGRSPCLWHVVAAVFGSRDEFRPARWRSKSTMSSYSPATKLTAVIGDPVIHSLSPLLHNKIYENEKIDAVMLAFGNPSIEKLIAAMRALPIHLAAVTMPHKQTIMPLLDEIDEAAHEIGAVNTVVSKEGKLTGYNTDIVGIAKALEGVTLKNAEVLLVGAGGAARTVAHYLRSESANIYCHNRDSAQAEQLSRTFGAVHLKDLADGPSFYRLIVNATPIGMNPNPDAIPVPETLIKSDTTVFDLVYSPLETKFLKTARAKGARAISGLTMFLEQGLEQERLWLGKTLDPALYAELLESRVRSKN